MCRKQHGSSLDDFLESEGICNAAQARAVKEVVVWREQQVDHVARGPLLARIESEVARVRTRRRRYL